MSLIATAGASDANSYNTLVEFDAYLDTLLTPGAAADASDGDKEKALITATPILDARGCDEWIGDPTSSDQALVWPRTGATDRNGATIDSAVIPTGIKRMHAELARLILNGTLDPAAENSAAAQGITMLKAGPVTLQFRDQAGNLVLPDSVRQFLVPSWCVSSAIRARLTVL